VYYVGSKARHAAEIIAITCAKRRPGQTYVEPFVGGGNVICRIPTEDGPRIGSDVNWRMIKLLDAVGNQGWLPPENVTEEFFNLVKANQEAHPPELVAYIATACTYGSKWLDVFARGNDAKGNPRNLPEAGRQNLLKDVNGLRGVKFLSLRYQDLAPHIPPESIIYCDPPYFGTLGYSGAKTDIAVGQDLSLNTWDRAAFWRWADERVEDGHRVYVSEYAGPPTSIYSKVSPAREAASARFRALQTDSTSTREDREAAAAAIRAVQQEEKAEAARLAARWKCMWEKEVVSSFDSGRGTEGKREVEKLFHRVP
jgi:DNA adenine methylase